VAKSVATDAGSDGKMVRLPITKTNQPNTAEQAEEKPSVPDSSRVKSVPVAKIARKASVFQPPPPELAPNQIGLQASTNVAPAIGKATISRRSKPVIPQDEIPVEPETSDTAITSVPITPRPRRASAVQPSAPALAPNQIGLQANPNVEPVMGKATVTKRVKPVAQKSPVVPAIPDAEITSVPITPRPRNASAVQPPAPALAPNQIGLQANPSVEPVMGKATVTKRVKPDTTEPQPPVDTESLMYKDMSLSNAITILFERIKELEEIKRLLDELSKSFDLVNLLIGDSDKKHDTQVGLQIEALREEMLAKFSQIINTIPPVRPPLTVSGLSNPALLFDEGTQQLLLNLGAQGSYDPSASRAKTSSIQSALDELFSLRQPSSIPGNRMVLDQSGMPYVADVLFTSRPNRTAQITYADGVLNAPPRVFAHIKKTFDQTSLQSPTFNDGWEVIWDTLRTVAPMAQPYGSITIPESGYYHLWATATMQEGTLVITVNGKDGKNLRSASSATIEWRGSLNSGDIVAAFVHEASALSEIELGLELLAKQS